jgi:hypothetical protein
MNQKSFSEVIPTDVLNNSLGDISFSVPENEYRNADSEILTEKEEKKLKMKYTPIFKKLILYFQLDRYYVLKSAKVEYIFMNPIKPIDVLGMINEFYLENASTFEIDNALSVSALEGGLENDITDTNWPIKRDEILGNSNFFEGFSTHGDGSEVDFGS